MSQFYNTAQGNRSERTCQGTKQSGLYSHTRGWNLGGSVHVFYCPVIEADVVKIKYTSGSNNQHGNLQTYPARCLNYQGELVKYTDYRQEIEHAKETFSVKREKIEFRRQYKKGDFWKWYADTKTN